MNSLSKREKVLIIVMVWVALIVGGLRYGVMPQVEKNMDLQEKKASLQTEKMNMQTTIQSKAVIEGQIEETKIKIKKMNKHFQGEMENEEMDRLITGIALGSGFTPLELEIGIMDESESSKSQVVSEDEANGEDQAEANDEKSKEQADSGAIVLKKLSVGAEGNIGNLNKFLDNVIGTKGLRLVSFTFGTKQTADDRADVVEGNGGEDTSLGAYEFQAIVEIYQIAD